MRRTVTFRQKQFEDIRNHLLRDDGREHVAFLTFGSSFIEEDPWTEEKELRILCRDVDLVSDEDLISNRGDNISWDNNRFLPVLQRAEEKKFSVGVIHSHPGGFNSFSVVDDDNEKRLFQMAFNRNGNSGVHASFVMTPPGTVKGRIWNPSLEFNPVDFTRILGERFAFQFERLDDFESPEFLHRQKLAFGDALIEELAHLRIGVVGCGATGSATAHLLARMGVGHLLLIDKDTVDITNLNRLHGAGKNDVGFSKAEVLKKTIIQVGLGTKVFSVADWVSSEPAKKALKACDVIFGCSDDHAGRILLNRFAYFYLAPVIDMGLTIHVTEGLQPQIRALLGRVTVILPGNRCLNCLGITNSGIAYAENLRRSDPDRYKLLKEEAYVIGEGNPNPAVGTFTTETSTIATNEFLHRIEGYRTSGSVDHRLRFFHLDEDIKPPSEPNIECRICGSTLYWGRGDMIPFLDMV